MEKEKYYRPRPGTSHLRRLEQFVCCMGQTDDIELCNTFQIEKLYEALRNDEFETIDKVKESEFGQDYVNVLCYLKGEFQPSSPKGSTDDDLEYLYDLEVLIRILQTRNKQ